MSIKGIFLDKLSSNNLDIKEIEPYFTHYNPAEWEISNSGSFTHELEGNGNIVLYFVKSNDFGFSFRYDLNSPNEREGTSFYSLSNRETINEFTDAGDMDFVPLGSCINDNEKAFAIIKDFFTNPKQKSAFIEWIGVDEIDWTALDEKY
jgi:hypothetical protein